MCYHQTEKAISSKEAYILLFFYIRHGDPIYNPDSLTPLGRRQAEALGKRLARYGLDKIYASPLKRAQETAAPACELLKKEMTVLDWTSEALAWEEFASPDTTSGYTTWFFQNRSLQSVLVSPEMRALGADWFRHPALAGRVRPRGRRAYGIRPMRFLLRSVMCTIESAACMCPNGRTESGSRCSHIRVSDWRS